MVKHIFLTCGVLLSATAQTTFAKELEGMLVTQNNYVRIKSCDLKNNYTLLPGSGNGYEAAAEIISVRKNTPENTPIYVGLRGNLENTNFLISGIDLIKIGESCHVPHTETPPAEVVIREYPLTQQKSGSTGGKSESKQGNLELKATESQQTKAEQDKSEETVGKSEEPVPYPEVTQTNQSEDSKKSEDKSNSDDLVKESVKAEDAKRTDTEKKIVENKEIDTSAKAEVSETVEVPAKAETHETVEKRITTETTPTTQALVVEEVSIKAVDIEEYSSVSEPVAPVVLPAESQPIEATTVFKVKPETGKQDSPSLEHEPLAPQVDIQREETHSAHNTLSASQ